MRKPYISGIAGILTVLIGCATAAQSTEGAVIYLDNGTIKAGFLPEVGGRMVFLGRGEGVNLLKSDTALWSEPETQRIKPDPASGWKAYNGHIIWPGPQSGWWSAQELNQERKAAFAAWPPDPYLIYSAYKLVDIAATSVVLEGPPSPVSGIQLTKKYSLTGSFLDIEVTMTNTSGGPVSWDIWSIARFEGHTPFFVPHCENGILRITGEENKRSGKLDSRLIDGAFTFLSVPPGPGQSRRYAKAFLHPAKGRIVAVRDSTMLVISFDQVEQGMIHPEQGFVEIYKMITGSGKGDLLELEHHSAFETLQPGESFTVSERWAIYAYKGEEGMKDYIEFYNHIQE